MKTEAEDKKLKRNKKHEKINKTILKHKTEDEGSSNRPEKTTKRLKQKKQVMDKSRRKKIKVENRRLKMKTWDEKWKMEVQKLNISCNQKQKKKKQKR